MEKVTVTTEFTRLGLVMFSIKFCQRLFIAIIISVTVKIPLLSSKTFSISVTDVHTALWVTHSLAHPLKTQPILTSITIVIS